MEYCLYREKQWSGQNLTNWTISYGFAEQLNLSMISSLVTATLNTLDDSLLPSATWVLELQDDREQLEEATGIVVTPADITTFQEQVTKLFIAHLKETISSNFSFSNNFISVRSIFDYRKAPKADSWTPDLSKHGEEAIGTFLVHYGSEKNS